MDLKEIVVSFYKFAYSCQILHVNWHTVNLFIKFLMILLVLAQTEIVFQENREFKSDLVFQGNCRHGLWLTILILFWKPLKCRLSRKKKNET